MIFLFSSQIKQIVNFYEYILFYLARMFFYSGEKMNNPKHIRPRMKMSK